MGAQFIWYQLKNFKEGFQKNLFASYSKSYIELLERFYHIVK